MTELLALAAGERSSRSGRARATRRRCSRCSAAGSRRSSGTPSSRPRPGNGWFGSGSEMRSRFGSATAARGSGAAPWPTIVVTAAARVGASAATRAARPRWRPAGGAGRLARSTGPDPRHASRRRVARAQRRPVRVRAARRRGGVPRVGRSSGDEVVEVSHLQALADPIPRSFVTNSVAPPHGRRRCASRPAGLFPCGRGSMRRPRRRGHRERRCGTRDRELSRQFARSPLRRCAGPTRTSLSPALDSTPLVRPAATALTITAAASARTGSPAMR